MGLPTRVVACRSPSRSGFRVAPCQLRASMTPPTEASPLGPSLQWRQMSVAWTQSAAPLLWILRMPRMHPLPSTSPWVPPSPSTKAGSHPPAVNVLQPIAYHGVLGTVVRASAGAELNGERKRQSIYISLGHRPWSSNSLYIQSALSFCVGLIGMFCFL
jgi:hypothetical protein